MTWNQRISLLRQDIGAGIVVFLVALPLCLGIAQAVGAPPLAGLLSGIIGGLAITLLSPSPLSVSGPAAGLITLTLSAVATLGSLSALLTALVLAGLVQVIMGVLRIGRLAGLIPSSVIRGMLAAIGLMLILQQLPVAVGYIPDRIWFQDISLHIFQDVTPGSVFILLGSLILLIIWEMPYSRRVGLTRIPAPLIVVFWGILAVTVLSQLDEVWRIPLSQRVQLPDWSPGTGWPLSLPDWSVLYQPALYSVALSIAIVASLETLLSLEATTKIDPLHRAPHSDRELMAQGTGNLLSGLLGGLPLTAVIVRSSANVYAGAQTRFSAFFHGVLLLLSALYLAPLLNTIPLASLSAILIFTGYKLASPTLFITQWRQGITHSIPFAVTVLAILAVGMLEGIALGMVCQLLFSVMQAERNTLNLTTQGNIRLLQIHKNITFMSKPQLCRLLDSIPDNSMVFVETAPGVVLPPDLLEVLKNFETQSGPRGLSVEMSPQLQTQLAHLSTFSH
ncbi:Sulfate permease, MFS superfamily [Serratia sp. JKS296]|uniref:SulP family inorganic anion transporter n=1 Tax=Serratia sp. JKS296 TaxID=1938824 RepID=UPI000BD6ED1F|nr:SulP family inorganic anion transporter [Serratia sp. JKS296]SOD79449.1 Sulfate permease, MFS superfamily [Serratia sp. JKS296]